jgi:D-arabinose 1-dehydrogenase-like Zn-dependent alcohol dehydrogenase
MQSVLKKGGTLIQVGAPPVDVELPLSLFTLLFGQLSIVGSLIGSYEEVDVNIFKRIYRISN